MSANDVPTSRESCSRRRFLAASAAGTALGGCLWPEAPTRPGAT